MTVSLTIEVIRAAVAEPSPHRLTVIRYLEDWLARRPARLTPTAAAVEGVDGVVSRTLLKLVDLWDGGSPFEVRSVAQFFAYCGQTFDTLVIDQNRRFAAGVRTPDRPVTPGFADSRAHVHPGFRKPQSTPSHAMRRAEDRSALQQAIVCLPKELRIVVTRHFLEGVPNGELAEELGVKPYKITRWVKKAAELLRDLLEGDNASG